MAYTAPTTRTTGDLITASIWNTDIVDNITTLKTLVDAAVPPGAITPYAGGTAPSTWLLCDGSTYSNDSYVDLLSALISGDSGINNYGGDAGTAFTADAGTDTLTAASHGLSNGDVIALSTSASDLPDPLSINTIYYVISAATNTFQLSTSSGGSAVDLTDAGTGTHNFHIQFKVPDLRGRLPLGQDDMGGSSANRVTDAAADGLGGSGGEENHTLTEAEIPAHDHASGSAENFIEAALYGGGLNRPIVSSAGQRYSIAPAATVGSGNSHNNMPPYLTLNYIIKT